MRITLHDIHKHYGKVRANDGISIEINPGSIHGILGENGAGKSTLMKVLAGYITLTSGRILIDDKPANFAGPLDAARFGIGMLYQDPLDFPPFSILENFMMEAGHGLTSNKDAYRQKLLSISDHFGFYLNPDSIVQNLTVGERQQLELMRLLARGVEVLILDEPTTGISAHQRQTLFEALRKLREQEKTILLVSHKLEDVEALCDKVTVLRKGKVEGEASKPFAAPKLLDWMFGGMPPSPPCTQITDTSSRIVLKMERVSAPGGRAGLTATDFTIRRGEIAALTGLEGSGQELFLRVAAGVKKPLQGRIWINEKEMTGKDHHAFKSEGVTFLPAARMEEGLIPGLTIAEHFAINFGKGMKLSFKQAEGLAVDGISRFRIVGEPHTKAESLSGGNQQRLLLALLPSNPRLLLLEHPTRGLDVDSVRWVWEKLVGFAERGASILFSTVELDEVFRTADRVVVFFNGALMKDLRCCDTAPNEVVQAIAGKT
jgi:general nucleoside transport system ATP-binding protein